eukprot:SAG31_NODE_8793_length_1386_cov_1.098679_1_plen_336_part_00
MDAHQHSAAGSPVVGECDGCGRQLSELQIQWEDKSRGEIRCARCAPRDNARADAITSDSAASGNRYDQQPLPRHLNVFSKGFDPSRALSVGVDAVPLPVPEAQPFDNITVWPLRHLADDPTFDVAGQFKKASALEEARRAAIKQVAEERSIELRRKREKLEEYQRTGGRLKEVADNCAALGGGGGPLAALSRWRDGNEYVVVHVRGTGRGPSAVRSKLHGALLGFDKHFNLLLRDVQELYLNDRDRAAAPEHRHLKQLFVSGDGVICIQLAKRDTELSLNREPQPMQRDTEPSSRYGAKADTQGTGAELLVDARQAFLARPYEPSPLPSMWTRTV